jgi:hypothetical protein
VEPEDLFVLAHALRNPRLEPQGKALVEFRAQLLRHRVVRGVANQDVPEAEAVVAGEDRGGRANELLADERHQMAADVPAGRLG